MEILGDRKYVEIAGDRTHELPPLLVRSTPGLGHMDRVVNLAASIVESEDMLPAPATEDVAAEEAEIERRRWDLALNLADQYKHLIEHWKWGDSIVEWIRQCEMTFELRPELRRLLRPDLWPHAGRRSFITLLKDKAVVSGGVDLGSAVGLRLTFRHPPPIHCFSNQFLFYLKSAIAATAYQTWASMTPEPLASLPPERFHFEVVDLAQ